jgi:hypothetical protein
MYQRFSFDENHMLHYEVSDTYGLKCIHKWHIYHFNRMNS